jgi:hypothetical protein
MILDFHVPTKALLNLQVPVIEGLKTGLRRRRMRRRLVDGHKFEKMRATSWHTTCQIPPTFGQVRHYLSTGI